MGSADNPEESFSLASPQFGLSSNPESRYLTIEEACEILSRNLPNYNPDVPLDVPYVAQAVELFGKVAVEKALRFDSCDCVDDIANYVERHQNDKTWPISLGTLEERTRVKMTTLVYAVYEGSSRKGIALLHTLVKNLVHRPNDEKVRVLRFSNDNLKALLSKKESVELLELVGFEQSKVMRKKPPFVDEKCLRLPFCPLSNIPQAQFFLALYSMLDDMLPILPIEEEKTPPSQGLSEVGRERKSDGQLTRECLANIHERRLEGKNTTSASSYQRGGGRIVRASPMEKNPENDKLGAVQDDNTSYSFFDAIWPWGTPSNETPPGRANERPTPRVKKHFNLKDIEDMRYKDAIGNCPRYAEEYLESLGKSTNLSSLSAKYSDPKYLGMLCLDKTNLFRGQNGLPPLKWSDGMFPIAREHAQDMANGVMPFSHEGFGERVRRFPFFYRSAAENLAWNEGMAHPAEQAVAGWITSPGHRKNLLSASNLCAIGAGMANGRYYFTQLFANNGQGLC